MSFKISQNSQDSGSILRPFDFVPLLMYFRIDSTKIMRNISLTGMETRGHSTLHNGSCVVLAEMEWYATPVSFLYVDLIGE